MILDDLLFFYFLFWYVFYFDTFFFLFLLYHRFLGLGRRGLVSFLLVVADCEHIVVLDAIFEQLDGHICIKQWNFVPFFLDKVLGIGYKAAPKGLVERLVAFIFAEVENVVDIL